MCDRIHKRQCCEEHGYPCEEASTCSNHNEPCPSMTDFEWMAHWMVGDVQEAA